MDRHDREKDKIVSDSSARRAERVLDVGCAVGRFSRRCAPHGARATGVDFRT
jgi:2-polyprenyl-3-methyl-5-hydroxy-6-metoxy-1,4-benzoquinol methylase